MPHKLISHLKEGDAVQQFFLVRQAESRTDKTGKPYLSLVLGDKSGTIVGQVWNDILKKCPGPFAAGDFVGLKGQVDSYKQELQINVKYMETVESLRSRGGDLSAFDPELLIQATPYDRQELWQELRQLAETQISPPLGPVGPHGPGPLPGGVPGLPRRPPYHHPYLGGLLEHTWFVTRHALASLAIYPELNRDLALAGAILHDLGKVKEWPTPRPRNAPCRATSWATSSWAGRWSGPPPRALDFPDPILLVQLEHIILSHHGTMEFGSPSRSQDPGGPAGKFPG